MIARLSTPSQEIGCPSTIVVAEAVELRASEPAGVPIPGTPCNIVGVTVNTATADTYYIGIDGTTISPCLPPFGPGFPCVVDAVILTGQTMSAGNGVVQPCIVQSVEYDNSIMNAPCSQPTGQWYVTVYSPNGRPAINAGDKLQFSPTPKFRGNNLPSPSSTVSNEVYAMPQLAVMETEPVDSLLDLSLIHI